MIGEELIISVMYENKSYWTYMVTYQLQPYRHEVALSLAARGSLGIKGVI